MYKREYKGIKLTQSQFSALDFDNKFCGHISYENLDEFLIVHNEESLLNDQKAVGIRFYYSLNETETPWVYGRAVRENGLEVGNNILISSHDDNSLISSDVNNIRERAKSEFLDLREQGKEVFSAFFSETAINELVRENFTGISFYEIRLSDLDEEAEFDSESPGVRLKGRADRTFIGIASRGTNPQNIEEVDNITRFHVISDLPCPGYCIQQESKEPAKNLRGWYLIQWQ